MATQPRWTEYKRSTPAHYHVLDTTTASPRSPPHGSRSAALEARRRRRQKPGKIPERRGCTPEAARAARPAAPPPLGDPCAPPGSSPPHIHPTTAPRRGPTPPGGVAGALSATAARALPPTRLARSQVLVLKVEEKYRAPPDHAPGEHNHPNSLPATPLRHPSAGAGGLDGRLALRLDRGAADPPRGPRGVTRGRGGRPGWAGRSALGRARRGAPEIAHPTDRPRAAAARLGEGGRAGGRAGRPPRRSRARGR